MLILLHIFEICKIYILLHRPPSIGRFIFATGVLGVLNAYAEKRSQRRARRSKQRERPPPLANARDHLEALCRTRLCGDDNCIGARKQSWFTLLDDSWHGFAACILADYVKHQLVRQFIKAEPPRALTRSCSIPARMRACTWRLEDTR